MNLMVLNIATAMLKVYSQIILFVNYYKLNQLKLFKYSGEYGEGFKLSYKFAAYLLLRALSFFIFILYFKSSYSVCIIKKVPVIG